MIPKSAPKQSQVLTISIISSTVLFGILYVWFVLSKSLSSDLNFAGWCLVYLKVFVEVCSLLYGIAFLFIGFTYLFMPPDKQKWMPADREMMKAERPPVGIIYLCCNDIDADALSGISQVNYDGELHLVIHDDSIDVTSQNEVDNMINQIKECRPDLNVRLLRRPVKGGGKAAVMNYVLAATGSNYEYFVMCDNDSVILQPDTIQKALTYFSDNKIAIAQFRTVGIDSNDYCTANHYLKKCIDAFHVFMSVFSRYGWKPFVGHNAILRTRAVMEEGGFTTGFFSDDLDLTIRLNLKGHKVIYAPDIMMGEKHPPSYASFRKRAYKWSYGCMQSARAHFLPVMKSHEFTFAEKFTFLFFIGFYFMQGILLLYLVITFVIFPWNGILNPFDPLVSIIAGSIIILTIFFPFICYFIKEGTIWRNIKSILFGGLIYGSTDFQSILGIWDCLRNKKREWIPTNQRTGSHSTNIFAEVLFGILLLFVPLFKFPSLLFLPSSYLFAGKFLFIPGMYALYDDSRSSLKHKILRTLSPTRTIGTCLIVFFLISGMNRAFSRDVENIEIKGKDLYVDGTKFLVKGIQYSPWRPGTGPNKNYPYPVQDLIAQDLNLIKKLNVNTLLVYDAPDYLLDIAKKQGLLVVYVFSINWYALGTEGFNEEKEKILKKVESLKGKSNILAWELGNEIPVDLFQKISQYTIEKEMRDIYNSVKSADSNHFVTHGNWPPTKSLKFDFLDFQSFNVYPVWPPEVVAQGYGNYISQYLQPIAKEKPLLISEFGVNSLEAGEDGQSRIVQQCWKDILEAKACGGIVFSFADEWWKNYNNPIRPDQWWYRNAAPDDELTHDLDPEEYYGIMHSDRTPKPAYGAVQKMFSTSDNAQWNIPSILVGSLIVFAAGIWLFARRHS